MESIPLRLPDHSYDVHVGRDLWTSLASHLAAASVGARLILITDQRVRPLHAEPLAAVLRQAGLRIDLLSFPAGEEHKTRQTKADLEDRMVALGAGRDTAVLAVGGGVVGDLAGFVAATYLRGIPFVQVPTTLLAMVDASIGGKTGHDLPGGKNLIGAFHHPASVWVDLQVLGTCSEESLREGLAEVLKGGLVADATLVEQLESQADRLLQRQEEPLRLAVTRALRIKAGVVGRDPREAGERAILNFGHTVGHALEAASGYAIPHGRAVAIGCAVEADLSAQLGLLNTEGVVRVRRALGALGLPVEVPRELDRERVIEACRRDKKARSGMVRCVLLQEVGAAARRDDSWTFPVEEGLLAEVLERATAS